MSTYEPLVREMARANNIPEALGVALVEVESGFDPDSVRAEPRYKYLWNVKTNRPFRRISDEELASCSAPKDFPSTPGVSRDTEFLLQKTSWGLGQLMGANARALGFKGKFFTRLCSDPAEGLRLAFLHLSNIARPYLPSTGWQGVMAAYNAGSPRRAADGSWANQEYVDKIARALGGAWPK
ncbi:MAG: transglycosylase SLT domain-containing protein [Thermodesulfobacteriota bacterium]